MPLPIPHTNEKQEDFISRCAGDKIMNKDYPDTSQRVAVCHSSWRKAKGIKQAKCLSCGTTLDDIGEIDIENLQCPKCQCYMVEI